MANGFSAGDLTLSIGTTANETLKVLDAIIGRLDLIEKGLGGVKGNSSYIRKSSRTPKSSGFGLAKFGVSVYMLRRMGRGIANLVQAGSDYTETLNLWQVAMRNNLDVADQFINKMQKAYGISTKTLMNAQAIFKNMIGSLGQISDQTAYKLSEALVQMSADFSSLYNVKLESAFEKMQAMLAGQVRPIRSAGLDMTETTLFMFYQQLGGTKTMRQLNRTEKQLLSILAVYQQMGSAGALGDMSKTLNQFANQSRMMTQYWQELKTWSGLLLKDLLEDWQVLTYINAALITFTEIVKAIAKSRGLGEENFIDGLFETTSATNDEVDELQGKLLDFDKFRSLEGASASPLAIDEKLLQAITGYSSKIDQAQNAAQQLANEWGEILGFTIGANGEWEISEENLEIIQSKFKSILGIASSLASFLTFNKLFKNIKFSAVLSFLSYAYTTNEEFRESLNNLIKQLSTTLFPLIDKISTVLTPILTVLVNIVTAVISFLDKAGLIEEVIIAFLSYKLGRKLFDLGNSISKVMSNFFQFSITLNDNVIPATQNATKKISSLQAGMAALSFAVLGMGISYFVENLDKLNTTAKILIPVISLLVAAFAGLAVAHAAAKAGIAAPVMAGATAAALVAGIGLAVGTAIAIPNYEMGASDIDSGTVFRAGEFGKTEAVYTGSNGKTNVANVRQMEQAFYNALSRHSREGNGTIVVQAYLDGEKVYENTTEKAKARGKVWANA